MNTARQLLDLMEEEKCFLKTLLYFDIFNYPLTAQEIVQYSSASANFLPTRFLNEMISQKILFRFQDFYSVQNNPELAARRLKGNMLAEQKMETAKFFSRLISSFPFVRAVMLSGSISKGYMDEKSDIDYFIITEENRLWFVRTALALFRRIFLFNSGKNLCTNYFIDTQNLEIREKNIFTAIELSTLQPMFGASVIRDFQSANPWALSLLPNIQYKNGAQADDKLPIKNLLEKIFTSRAFDRFNMWLTGKTISYWKRRYGHELNANDFEIAFRSTQGVSKSHPQFFQKKVLAGYHQKIKEFETQHEIDLAL